MSRAAVLLCLLTLAAVRPGRADELSASAPRVATVELRLPPGEDRAALVGLVALAPGDRLSSRALRRTVQRLFQTGRFRNVVVHAAAAPRPSDSPPGSGAEWVSLVVEGQPVRVLSTVEVKIDGPPVLDAAGVRAAARLVTAEPFDVPDLEAAEARVRDALARRGYRAAEVTAELVRENGAVLRVRAGEPLRVRSVRIGGTGEAPPLTRTLRTRAGAVLDADVLDADGRAILAALHAAGYRRARVGVPAVKVEGLEADVEVPVDAGPRLVFGFRGNEEIESRVLSRQLGFDEGEPIDAPTVAAAAERVRAFYRARGYADARVEVEEAQRGRVVTVVFHVDEGRRYLLADVTLEGVAQRDVSALRAQLAALLDEEREAAPDDADAERARELVASVPGVRPARVAPAPLPPREAWDEVAWERAAERIVDDYRAAGWLEAVYLGSSVRLDAPSRRVAVTLRLREGPRTTVESISFEGNREVSLAELARESRLSPGDPLAFAKVEETRAAMLRLYLSRGHLYARVDAREVVDRDRHVAAVRFVVEEGPQVRIGRILLTGNRRTREHVVRRALSIEEGDVYDPEAIAASQTALLRLGVFRSVSLRVQEPEAPQQTKDLAVEIAERPWATLAQGVGFSVADGPRAFVEYGQPNVLGRALELSARTKVNYPVDTPFFPRPDIARKRPGDRIEGRADLGLRVPNLEVLPFPAGGRANVIAEVLHRAAYDLRRATAIAGLDVGLTSRVGASLQYELEIDKIERQAAIGFLTQADVERLRFNEGVTTLHALRPSVSIDHRDNSAHPRRGWAATGALEYARSLGSKRDGAPDARSLFGLLPASGIHTNMLKLSGGASAYLPLGRSTVIALSLRGGRVFPLDDRSQTIIPRRFFLGGSATMRGFGEEELIPQDVRDDLAAEARHCATSPTGVGCTTRGRRITDGERPVSEGGEAFLLAKGELRVPLRGSVEAGFFVDLGNVWLDPVRYRLVDLRANAGFGLRFVTPIGPAALDLGFNLMPDATLNERILAPHFTIGLF